MRLAGWLAGRRIPLHHIKPGKRNLESLEMKAFGPSPFTADEILEVIFIRRAGFGLMVAEMESLVECTLRPS